MPTQLASTSPYRLGLDLGTNSIGWAVLDLDAENKPSALRDVGVRIFSDGRDPKGGSSLAVDRRVARGARRRRGRYKERRARLVRLLVELGLMPNSPEERKKLLPDNPYQLRSAAVTRPLQPYELGRALFHINQRRGFGVNRRLGASVADTKQEGKISSGAKSLQGELDKGKESITLGQYLDNRFTETGTARFKPEVTRFGNDFKDDDVGLYPTREMIEHELKTIRDRQSREQSLTDEQWESLCNTILFQRTLIEVDPGRCTLDPEEKRAPLALPTAQRFRILHELANLRINVAGEGSLPLEPKGKEKLLKALLDPKKLNAKGELSFTEIKKILGIKSNLIEFNLADSKRSGLLGDQTALRLTTGMGKNGTLIFTPEQWAGFGLQKQDDIVEALIKPGHGKDENSFKKWQQQQKGDLKLQARAEKEWNLTPEAAQHLLNTPLPTGHSNFGRTALGKIVPFMEKEFLMYHQAVKEAGYESHSDFKGTGKSEVPCHTMRLPSPRALPVAIS